MSVKREHSFTVRLSIEEKATLDALSKRFNLDKSATVRKAIQLVVPTHVGVNRHCRCR